MTYPICTGFVDRVTVLRCASVMRAATLVAALLLCAAPAGCAADADATPAAASASASATPATPAPTPSAGPTSSAGPPSSGPTQSAEPTPPPVQLPPVNAAFDYQIGSPYDPPAGVTVVSRDRAAKPPRGVYTICYVNAFQAQPAELRWWQAEHDDLLLRGPDGGYVIDRDWNEVLLDISTSAKRTAVAAIVNDWVTGCARAGFRAVEPDNLDSYERSRGLLTADDALALVALLAPHAHAEGLAVAQKNTSALGAAGRDAGLDFAIAEECGQYAECADYTDVYGRNVIDIEYRRPGFRAACTAVGASISVVLRDVAVSPPADPAHVYDAC